MGSVERRLRRLEESFASSATLTPSDAPVIGDLPVERWLDEWMEGAIPEPRLKNTTDEELFLEWLKNLPKRLVWDVCYRHGVEAGVQSLAGIRELGQRVLHALPPYVERWRQLWVEHFPNRERRRKFNADMERLVGRVKTRENGYAWWFDAQEKYARLRAKYTGWEEEWAAFYPRWAEECEQPQRNAPMSAAMAEEFTRICFLRETHEQEEVTDFALIGLSESFEVVNRGRP
jgi:hypothetical protein